MASEIFITATDTDAGKTWVTGSVVRALLGGGVDATALKPVACGFDAEGRNADIASLLAAQGISDADRINRYRFALPAAPSQAAVAQNQSIDPETLVRWCDQQQDKYDCTLIEGVGGLMTPITDRWLVSDWIGMMPACEIWLVVGCRLGSINQTLLTLSKLRQMDREPAHIFFNAPTPDCNDWLEPTMRAITTFLPPSCAIQMLRYNEQPEIPTIGV